MCEWRCSALQVMRAWILARYAVRIVVCFMRYILKGPDVNRLACFSFHLSLPPHQWLRSEAETTRRLNCEFRQSLGWNIIPFINYAPKLVNFLQNIWDKCCGISSLAFIDHNIKLYHRIILFIQFMNDVHNTCFMAFYQVKHSQILMSTGSIVWITP